MKLFEESRLSLTKLAQQHLAPHWNWSGREGDSIPVIAYTNGDSAELFVNGKSMGFRHKGKPPARAINLALDVPVKHGSTSDGSDSEVTTLADSATTSTSGIHELEEWSSVDFRLPSRVQAIVIDFAGEAKFYGYRIEVSDEDGEWREVASHAATLYPLWGGVHEAVHRVDTEASKVRVVFTKCLEDVEPHADGIRVYADEYESPYYRPTYDHRLRWNEVLYEPGSIRVIAYRDGNPIGEDEVHTSGTVAKLTLTADRRELSASGEDLVYLTIEANDKAGVPCPHADNVVQVEVRGAGRLVAVGNGDPTSTRSFHDSSVSLFGGKAIAIVCPGAGKGGELVVTVTSQQLGECHTTFQSRPAAD